ncbi:MAG: anti-sigma factor [Actinobacteria bacterium HGW-Actinobacteria-8]|nr:MAG: anti-sigma factor [Actinobacteria bacterium HGW-Actinobacteria-8]
MSHPDDEVIAAAAMGETLDADDARHVAECARCFAHLRDLELLAARAAAMGRPAPLLTPPESVWDAVMAELATDDGAQDDAESVPALLREVGEPAERLATVTPIRRFSGWLVASAAAVGLVIGGIGVSVLANLGGDGATVVASTPLTSLVTDASAGDARVEDRSDGVRVLVVDTDYQEVPDGDLEVWLIDPNVEGMVSLGFLASSHGEFVIPAGYDPRAYPIVDISIEPRDGVPTHSGESITRGVLDL